MEEETPKEMPIKTEAHLLRVFEEVLIMADEWVLPLIIDTITANIMRLGPVWTCIVAPPSGGKSELLASTYGITEFIYPLSSLTPQTLVSGAHLAGGKSASLLDEIKGMVVVMKDLTTTVEMNKEDLRAILGQLREVYDKKFDKAFGTGERKNWEGHVGWLTAVTPAGAAAFTSHGAMGERFIFYRMKQPDRMEVLYKSQENQSKNMELQQLKLRNAMSEYLTPILHAALGVTDEERKVILESDTMKDIFLLSDFATRARSSVRLHWKTQDVEYVYDPEMPTRFANQLTSLAAANLFRKKFSGLPMKFTKKEMQMYTQIAWSSIPPHRADVIRKLAQYRRGSTQAIAAELRYETGIVRPWLAELAGLKVVRREAKATSGGPDIWYMEKTYRELVCEYTGIELLDTSIEEDPVDYVDQDYDGNIAADELEAIRLAEESRKVLGSTEYQNIDPETGQLIGADFNPNDPDDY